MTESQDKNKYGNPVKRLFIDRFMRRVEKVLRAVDARTILDIGCGEGYFIEYLSERMDVAITGIDIDQAKIDKARQKAPQHTFICADLYSADLAYIQAGLLIAMEVLEHLDDPGRALQRIAQLAPAAIITVPYEPWFSVLSFLGGNYLRTFGRHPDHVNAWSPRTLYALLTPYYRSVDIQVGFPWIIAVCRQPIQQG